MPSMAKNSKCPPSSTGIGNKFNTPKLTLTNAKIL